MVHLDDLSSVDRHHNCVRRPAFSLHHLTYIRRQYDRAGRHTVNSSLMIDICRGGTTRTVVGRSNFKSAMFTIPQNIKTCCPFLVFSLHLPPVVLVLQPPLRGTRSDLTLAALLLPIPSIVFLKRTVSSRLLAPPNSPL